MKVTGIVAAIGVSLACLPFSLTVSAERVADVYPFDTGCDYFYDRMSTPAQTLYNEMLVACREIDLSNDTTDRSYNIYYDNTLLSESDVQVLVFAFQYEHPEFFWLENSYSRGADYIHLNVYPEFEDGATRLQARADVLRAEKDYINGAMAYDTDYERADYLFRRLYDETTYGETELDQSLYSALVEKHTLCAGFTKAYSLLANAVGVPTISLMSPGHGWNASLIDGKWYHADVTNDLFLYSDDEIASFDKMAGQHDKVDYDGTVYIYWMHEYENEFYAYNAPSMKEAYAGGKAQAPSEIPAPDDPYVPDPLPQTPAVPGALPPGINGSYVPGSGDVSGDGILSTTDASRMLDEIAKQIVGTHVLDDEQMAAGDVDGDGAVTTGDVSTVLTHIASSLF